MDSELKKMIKRYWSWVEFTGASWCPLETRNHILSELRIMIGREFNSQ